MCYVRSSMYVLKIYKSAQFENKSLKRKVHVYVGWSAKIKRHSLNDEPNGSR